MLYYTPVELFFEFIFEHTALLEEEAVSIIF